MRRNMGPKWGLRSRGCTGSSRRPPFPGQSRPGRHRQYIRVRGAPFAAAAIRFLLFIGCRLREIPHLKWEQVDVERGPPKSACSRGSAESDGYRIQISFCPIYCKPRSLRPTKCSRNSAIFSLSRPSPHASCQLCRTSPTTSRPGCCIDATSALITSVASMRSQLGHLGPAIQGRSPLRVEARVPSGTCPARCCGAFLCPCWAWKRTSGLPRG